MVASLRLCRPLEMGRMLTQSVLMAQELQQLTSGQQLWRHIGDSAICAGNNRLGFTQLTS